MSNLVIILCCTLATSALVQAEPIGSPSCEEQFQQLMPQFLEQDAKIFDLDDDKGWRRLNRAGCTTQAAKALKEYVAKRGLPDHVYFHAGQLLAASGDYRNALLMLEKSTRLEDDSSEFKWNAYVRSIQAFLRGDLNVLREQRAVIASRPEVKGNQMNLRVVDKLLANFGKPYAEAVK